jgi:hypothetical protein
MGGERMTAPQIRSMYAAESLPATFGFAARLGSDTLTGTPTVTAVPDDEEMTIAAVSINEAAITVDGETQAIGQAVQTSISGGVAGTRYVLTVTASIDGGGTVVEECILEVE